MRLDVIRGIAPSLPVIGMTACPSVDVTRRLCEHGAIRMLAKPFDVFGLDRVLLEVCTGQFRP
jgi:DNA-binding NtrC family response regulator